MNGEYEKLLENLEELKNHFIDYTIGDLVIISIMLVVLLVVFIKYRD